MGHIIGIDVGSQSVKGILLSPEAEVLGAASAACTMTNLAPGWADQAPSSWERGIEQVVHQLMAAAGLEPAAVTYLGLACQVDGVVPVDRSGGPVRDGIIWLDRRASLQAQALADKVGADWMFATTGLNADASHIAPKIMWLHDEEPETYRAAAVMAPVGGYLLGWLTGVIAQDHANASSTLLYDVSSRAWSVPMLEASGIDPTQLAEIRPSHEVAGQHASRGRRAPRPHHALPGDRRLGRRARRLPRRRSGAAGDDHRRDRHGRAGDRRRGGPRL